MFSMTWSPRHWKPSRRALGERQRRRQPGKEHQIERVILRVRANTKIVAEQKDGFAQSNGNTQLDHHALIRRGAVDDREESIGRRDITDIGCCHRMGPTGPAHIDLVVARERFPHLSAHGLKLSDEWRQQQLTPLGCKAVGGGQIKAGAGHRQFGDASA